MLSFHSKKILTANIPNALDGYMLTSPKAEQRFSNQKQSNLSQSIKHMMQQQKMKCFKTRENRTLLMMEESIQIYFLSHFGLMGFIERLWMKVDWVLRESKGFLQPTDSRHIFLNTVLDFIPPISFQISITAPLSLGRN